MTLITDLKDERLDNSPKDVFTHDLYRDSLRAVLAVLEKVVEAAERLRELTHEGDMLPLDGMWFDAMGELCAALDAAKEGKP